MLRYASRQRVHDSPRSSFWIVHNSALSVEVFHHVRHYGRKGLIGGQPLQQEGEKDVVGWGGKPSPTLRKGRRIHTYTFVCIECLHLCCLFIALFLSGSNFVFAALRCSASRRARVFGACFFWTWCCFLDRTGFIYHPGSGQQVRCFLIRVAANGCFHPGRCQRVLCSHPGFGQRVLISNPGCGQRVLCSNPGCGQRVLCSHLGYGQRVLSRWP